MYHFSMWMLQYANGLLKLPINLKECYTYNFNSTKWIGKDYAIIKKLQLHVLENSFYTYLKLL